MKARLLSIFLTLAVEAGAVYVPPEDTGTLFPKDALPVDSDTMRELARHLAVLAARSSTDDPVQQRATAQLVAMASRLDPTNQRAREVNRRLTKGRTIREAHPKELETAMSRSWQVAQWLLTEETGPAGRLVGHQLVDVLRIVDPGHAGTKLHEAGGENNRWKGVVAPLNRFRGHVEPPKPKPPKPTPPAPNPPTPTPPTPPVPRPPAPPIRLAEGAVFTPWEVQGGQTRQVELVHLTLKVTESEANEDLDLHLIPNPGSEAALEVLKDARTRILGVLTHDWQRLPEHRLATLQSGGNVVYSARNETAFSGPATLLLASAISGQPLRDKLIILGDVAADGTLHRPELAWNYLHKLRTGKGGRLIVPTRLEPQLRSLLALEEPDFFIRYEVIAANTLKQALTMAAADPGSSTLADADQEFARFREITAPANIGPLAVNKHVRERLSKILTANPGHLSAKMILLQGSRWRPTRLDRDTLVMELRRCLEPMEGFFGNGVEASNLTSTNLEIAFNACRSRLEPLEIRVDRSDRKLHDESRALVDNLRSLAQLRKLGEATPGDPLSLAYTELRVRYSRLLQLFESPREQVGGN